MDQYKANDAGRRLANLALDGGEFGRMDCYRADPLAIFFKPDEDGGLGETPPRHLTDCDVSGQRS